MCNGLTDHLKHLGNPATRAGGSPSDRDLLDAHEGNINLLHLTDSESSLQEAFLTLEIGTVKWCKEHITRNGNDPISEEGQKLIDQPDIWKGDGKTNGPSMGEKRGKHTHAASTEERG